MANDLTTLDPKMNIPAHILARQGGALSKDITGGITVGEFGPRISIKGSRFRIVQGEDETVLRETELDVVIVGANPRMSKQYYASAWDPNNVAAPDCFSLNGVAPDAGAESPQSDICATCPMNKWGSKQGPQGQDLKACSDLKRLAVVSPDDIEGDIFLLQATPAALKGLSGFQKALASRGIAPEVVKTTLSFDSDASFPKLMFSLGGFLTEEEIAQVDLVIGSEGVLKVTQATSEEELARLTTPKPAAAAAKPKAGLTVPAKKAAPAPAAVEEVQEEEPAPAPAKKGFGGKSGVTTTKAAPAAAPAAKAAPKVAKPAPKVAAADSDVVSEIEAMIAAEGGGADDATE